MLPSSLSTHRPVKRCKYESKWHELFFFSFLLLFDKFPWHCFSMRSSTAYHQRYLQMLDKVEWRVKNIIFVSFVMNFQILLEVVFFRANFLDFLGHKIVWPLKVQVKRFSFHFNRLCNQWIRYYYKHGDKGIRYEHGAVRNAVRNAWNSRHNYVLHLYRRHDQIWIQQNKCTSKTRTIIDDKKQKQQNWFYVMQLPLAMLQFSRRRMIKWVSFHGPHLLRVRTLSP